jgi:hypothetical protein
MIEHDNTRFRQPDAKIERGTPLVAGSNQDQRNKRNQEEHQIVWVSQIDAIRYVSIDPSQSGNETNTSAYDTRHPN